MKLINIKNSIFLLLLGSSFGILAYFTEDNGLRSSSGSDSDEVYYSAEEEQGDSYDYFDFVDENFAKIRFVNKDRSRKAQIAQLIKDKRPLIQLEDSSTLLHQSVSAGSLEEVNMIISYLKKNLRHQIVSQLNIVDAFGETALFEAVRNGYQRIAAVLIQAGIDTSITNCDGIAAFDYCSNADIKFQYETEIAQINHAPIRIVHRLEQKIKEKRIKIQEAAAQEEALEVITDSTYKWKSILATGLGVAACGVLFYFIKTKFKKSVHKKIELTIS